ncbi:hypothetical protein ACFL28_05330, partial [Candidatus Omnitrophota bacterium]
MQSERSSSIKITVLCSISFVVVSYLIFRTNLPKLETIFLYNLIIIISLQGLGFYRGLFFLGASTFLTLLTSLAAEFYCAWCIPVFFITFSVVNNEIKRLDYYNRIIETRIEELKENTNILVNDHNRHKKEALSLEKKEQRYRQLKDVTSNLSSTLSVDKLTELISDHALQIVGKSDSAL